MTSLGDAFPEEERKRFADEKIIIGTVIKAFVADTNPPKEKRFIIVGESYDHLYVACVFINSEINENVLRTEALKEMNIPFQAQQYEFLDHDSYVDCSSIQPRDKSWLKELVQKEPQRVLGTVSEYHLKEMRKVIKNAPTIKSSLKKTFGLFL